MLLDSRLTFAMKKYWLLKTEPETYGWVDLERLDSDHWEGVRNYQARNYLKEMRAGDYAFFYHSGQSKEIVGLVEVLQSAYQDPTTDDKRWVSVRVRPVGQLQQTVTLDLIKSFDQLKDMVLLKNSRLSVQPVEENAYEIIMNLSQTQ
ncbi:MAG: putative RNA-binding protein with PUA-like domain [Cyclobacteriaceae bacterium]